MKKVKEPKVRHFCRECAHARDFHSMNLNNEPICCKCDFKEFSQLLNYDCCEHFKMKKD